MRVTPLLTPGQGPGAGREVTMIGDSCLPRPGKLSRARAVSLAETQPSLPDDGIRAVGDFPQSQAGITGVPDERSPFRGVRRGDLMAAAGSLLTFCFSRRGTGSRLLTFRIA